jgi:hypothetical protein
MGWRSSEIEVTTTVDLCDYDDEVMEYVEPDNIEDALELMERWGYSDGYILAHMLDDMDNELFLSKVADILTVESALSLVKDVYVYGRDAQVRHLTAKDNQIKELKQRVDDLLALNHTVITEQKEETTDDTQNV